AQQHEKERAYGIKSEVKRLAAYIKLAPPFPICRSAKHQKCRPQCRRYTHQRQGQPQPWKARAACDARNQTHRSEEKQCSGCHRFASSLFPLDMARSASAAAAKISRSLATFITRSRKSPCARTRVSRPSKSKCARGEGAMKKNKRVTGVSSGAGPACVNGSRKSSNATVPESRPSDTRVRGCGKAKPSPMAAHVTPSAVCNRCVRSW